MTPEKRFENKVKSYFHTNCTACGGRECTVNVGELARFCPHCGTPIEVDE